MDLESRRHREECTKAKEVMLDRAATAMADRVRRKDGARNPVAQDFIVPEVD